MTHDSICFLPIKTFKVAKNLFGSCPYFLLVIKQLLLKSFQINLEKAKVISLIAVSKEWDWQCLLRFSDNIVILGVPQTKNCWGLYPLTSTTYRNVFADDTLIYSFDLYRHWYKYCFRFCLNRLMPNCGVVRGCWQMWIYANYKIKSSNKLLV